MKPRSAKDKGRRFERTVAEFLAAALEDDRIERRRQSGAKDRGDIAGVRYHGGRVVVECKNVKPKSVYGTYTYSQVLRWLEEAEVEAGNDDALFGVVVAKAPKVGVDNVRDAWKHLVYAGPAACYELGWNLDKGQRFATRTLDALCLKLDGAE